MLSVRGLVRVTGIPRTTVQRLIGVLDGVAQTRISRIARTLEYREYFHDNILGVNDTSAAQSGPSKPNSVLLRQRHLFSGNCFTFPVKEVNIRYD